MNLRPLTALFALWLSACAGLGQDGRGYPSLAKRPVEVQGAGEAETASEVGVAVPAADDPELDRTIATLAEQARQGGAAFDRLYGEVAGRIRLSAPAAVSSEQWVTAQADLGRLEQARYGSVYALASLDTLYAERMKDVAEGKAVGGIDRIDGARQNALAIVDSQNDRVDALRAGLRHP
ncbi:MAG: hypothetical protein EP321_12220 [Sphingomonadales bacterium]|nr:MAG: hypothetical protein EP345_13990 [Sphingomonadales bacterium]TNF02857.1 MAG: hypothetical protein EP321_12220 [Sphingomonadales bacterium]